MGTPAVAIAHSSGFVTLGNAFKGGLILKIVSWIIFNFFVILLLATSGPQVVKLFFREPLVPLLKRGGLKNRNR